MSTSTVIGAPAAHTHRSDIQGLRAIAVGIVILYHVRPAWFPGGFAGVDVFFVISGYLITASLVAETIATGSVSLPRFWARRVRRLLPAATVVLVAVLAGTAAVLSLAQWSVVIGQVAASALSVQNWVLASESVSYLQATSAPSPVQHFWSLSVEEQFYIVWPLLIVGLAVLAGRLRRDRVRVLRVAVGVLAAASFAYSLAATALTPDLAYFSTFTRAWELLLGAALALWLPLVTLSKRMASLAFVGGLAAIAASVWVISPETAFPGYAALLPTLGAAGVIAGGVAGGPAVLRRLLECRPMVWVGDISYSLYLWHWPVIVFLGAWLQTAALPIWAVGAAIASSLVLAALSKRYVEDAFRIRRTPVDAPRGTRMRRIARSSVTLAAALLAVTALSAGLLRAELVRSVEAQRVGQAIENMPGARLLDPAFDRGSFPDLPVRPAPDVIALADVERQLTPECMSIVVDTSVTSCDAGDPEGQITVAILGDSHAAEWLPAIDEIGRAEGWKVVLAAKQSCPLVSLPEDVAVANGLYSECVDWNSNVRSFVDELRPDLVIASASYYAYPEGVADTSTVDRVVAAGYAAQYEHILGLGIPVAAIAETPIFTGFSAAECLSRRTLDIADCDSRMTEARRDQTSRVDLAVQAAPGVHRLDFGDLICPEGECAAALGNVVTFRDDNHITDPFARSLAWAMRERLQKSVPEFFGNGE